MAITLPDGPTPNEQLLAGWELERTTGITGTVLTLNRPCHDALLLLSKNGSIVDPDTVSVDGASVTLTSAAVSGDVFVVLYLARSN